MDRRWLTPVVLLVAALAAQAYWRMTPSNHFENPELVSLGMERPCIWIYYDDTDVNSRWWSDFGARSSRVLNLPFLNLCYQTIVAAAGQNYRVEVISGLTDAARRLGGWDALPTRMRNKRTPLRNEEMTYLKVAFLEKFGGLWIGPASICLRPFPNFGSERVVYFGSDPLETYAGPQGTKIPNQFAMYSGRAHHPVFVEWRRALYNRFEEDSGGREIRTDRNWDMLFVSSRSPDVSVLPVAELTRKKNGRKIELEDLLAAGTSGNLPFDIPSEALYVPFPWPELLERRKFGWFLRMSEDQVMESDLVVTHLFRAVGI